MNATELGKIIYLSSETPTHVGIVESVKVIVSQLKDVDVFEIVQGMKESHNEYYPSLLPLNDGEIDGILEQFGLKYNG